MTLLSSEGEEEAHSLQPTGDEEDLGEDAGG